MPRVLPVLLLISGALSLAGCASCMSLDELDTLPDGFPLDVAAIGEVGHITSAQTSSQVSVDVVFENKADAQAGWAALQDQAVAKGFEQTDTGARKKWDFVEMAGAPGKLELGCCPDRADRRTLVLVSWWPPGPTP